MITWTQDLSLGMSSLNYFTIAVCTCTWDTCYFNIVVNTSTWGPCLRLSLLDYFNMVTSTCTWDLGSLAFFNIAITLIDGILVYGCTSSQKVLRAMLS
jgi:hypothetical protein